MWPILIGLGAWIIAEGVRQGVNEHTQQTHKRLPKPQDPLYLTDDSRFDETEDMEEPYYTDDNEDM